MTFVNLTNRLIAFRRTLARYVTPALEEVTISPPTGESDELSFMRLVSWGYVVLHETARVPLSFLKSLPPWEHLDELLPHVHALRTLMSHNLAFDSDHNISISRRATEWYLEACAASSPTTSSEWEKCFDKLSKELLCLLNMAIKTCDRLDNKSIDGKKNIQELQNRLRHNWPAHHFDPYIQRAINKFGYEGLSAVKIRQRARLNEWRRLIACSDEDKIEENITRRIEMDVLEQMRSAPPISSDGIWQLLANPSNTTLASTLRILREIGPEKAKKIIELIEQINTISRNDSKSI